MIDYVPNSILRRAELIKISSTSYYMVEFLIFRPFEFLYQRGAMDVQTYQTAIREYMLHGHKNLRHLIQCSRALKVEDDVRRYLEVFLL